MSLPRYLNYKDSGVEWLGEVPEHWEVMAIRRVIASTLSNGIFKKKEDFGSGTLLLNVFDIYRSDFRVDFKSLERVNCKSNEISQYAVLPDDLFFVRSSLKQEGIAAVAVAGKWTEAIVYECHLIRARPKRDVFDGRFGCYVLNSTVYRAKMIAKAKMTTMTTIDQEAISSTCVPIPPIPEQTQIAAFLDRETAKIDELVAEQLRLMELLKEKRQAVISHAVTRGLNPHAVLKPSGIEWLGDVPGHWQVSALKRIADVQTGMAKGKDNGLRETVTLPYLRVANVQDGYLDLETITTMEIPASELNRYALKHGDVLMNEGGDFDKLGRGCVWECQIEPCITQNHVFAVRPKLVSSVWLNAITSSNFAQFYFMTRSKQSTNLASISSTNLMELPVILPPASEQHAILAFVAAQTSSFDTLTTEAQRAIDLLQERRAALISAAITGQIDVRDAVAA